MEFGFSKPVSATNSSVSVLRSSSTILEAFRIEMAERVENLHAELKAEFDPVRCLQQAAEVVKAMPAPEVTIKNDVLVQPPRLVEKRVDYDAWGRPVLITEKEVKE